MGAVAPLVEYEMDDLLQLAGSVDKINSVSSVALILRVIACMS